MNTIEFRGKIFTYTIIVTKNIILDPDVMGQFIIKRLFWYNIFRWRKPHLTMNNTYVAPILGMFVV